MVQKIGRILVDAVSARTLQLLLSVPAGQKSDAKSPSAASGQHIPNTVADDRGSLDLTSHSLRGCQEKIRVGFRALEIGDSSAGDTGNQR